MARQVYFPQTDLSVGVLTVLQEGTVGGNPAGHLPGAAFDECYTVLATFPPG